MNYDLDDPSQRRSFRRGLSEKGISDVRHLLATGAYAGKKAQVVAQWLEDVASGATAADELQDIIDAVGGLKAKFVPGSNLTGKFLKTEDQGAFLGLFMQARVLINEQLGEGNVHTSQLIHTVNSGSGGMVGGPSFACVTDVCELLSVARKQIERKALKGSVQYAPPLVADKDRYVHADRIADLRNLSTTNWDFRKLVQMCDELNSAWSLQHYLTVAMLVRAVLDHVPPIFGEPDFERVVAQHGGKSFKESMQQLDKSMRKIADAHLHGQIRKRETLPTATQVDARRELDVLLGEVVCRA